MLCYFYFPDPNSSFSFGFSSCTILLWVWKITRKRRKKKERKKILCYEQNWNFYLKNELQVKILFCLYWLGGGNFEENDFSCLQIFVGNFFLNKEFSISKLFELKIDIKLLEVVSTLKVFLMVGKLFMRIIALLMKFHTDIVIWKHLQ